MDNGKPFFPALIRFHNWFDPMTKPWAKWAYLAWMFTAFAFFNIGAYSAMVTGGSSGSGLASTGLAMLCLWFGTRFYWLYHTTIRPMRAWSHNRRSGR